MGNPPSPFTGPHSTRDRQGRLTDAKRPIQITQACGYSSPHYDLHKHVSASAAVGNQNNTVADGDPHQGKKKGQDQDQNKKVLPDGQVSFFFPLFFGCCRWRLLIPSFLWYETTWTKCCK